jgi:hypothetical protein
MNSGPSDAWNWDRQRCDRYLLELFGEPWARSMCVYCPFSSSRTSLPELVERWRAEPGTGAAALGLGYTALALNPRSRLFGKRSAQDVVHAHGLAEVWRQHQRRLSEQRWSVYEVRRIIHPRRADPTAKGPAWRSVRTLYTGDRDRAEEVLRRRAGHAGADVVLDEYGIIRAELRPRGAAYPAIEQTLALAPVGVQDKQRRRFEDWWEPLAAAPVLAGW